MGISFLNKTAWVILLIALLLYSVIALSCRYDKQSWDEHYRQEELVVKRFNANEVKWR